MDLLVKWVPGHVNIGGNEKADKEAKKVVQEGSSPIWRLPAPLRKTLPHSKSIVQQECHHKINWLADELWAKSPHYNKMKQIDVTLTYKKFTKLTCNIKHNHASLLIQLQSGHVPLNAIVKADSPIVPSCQQHKETITHYILHCKTHNNPRQGLFHKASRDTINISKLLSTPRLFPNLVWFIRRSRHLKTTPEKTIIRR